MKIRALVLVSVLLAGCQAPHASTPYPNTKTSSVRATDTRTSQASSQWATTDLAQQQGVWDYIGSTLKIPVPNNERIRSQKARYLRNKSHLQRVTERSEPYLYWIVEEVKKRNMPIEVALLPMVESAFDPNATSSANATGLWQITPATGRNYGLDQNWWYDGRRDIGASTRAALDLLQRLNKMFDGDWTMTLAAYNAGEGRILKAIKANKARNKKTDYWSLDLPRETALYVPKVLALSDIVRHADKYALKLPHIDKSSALARVNVGQQFDMNSAAQVAGMSVDELQALNPAYTTRATAPTGPHYLMLPKKKAKQFKKAIQEHEDISLTAVRHKVQSGESIDILARRYGVSALDIKQLNELNGAGIRRGQYVLLPITRSTYLAKTSASAQRDTFALATTPKTKSATTQSYTVRNGDTLSTIANRHKMSARELAKLNNINSNSHLKAGQTLKVSASSRNATTTSSLARSYKAKKGDSFYSIAQRHGVDVADLLRWNDMNRKSVLKPGTVLKVNKTKS
ncbi:MAG: LysM peptidoglycan-binding domain-containing protein [Plesiomonas sp.]|uniref:LysM peptidoglycan-binding domain-containing protein n=1 Tax=Plesiomonas sp. TaxID=2486279 RepID=UPI003F397DE1